MAGNKGILWLPIMSSGWPEITALMACYGDKLAHNKPVILTIPSDLLKVVNSHYDEKDLIQVIGGFHQTDFDRMILEQKCRELFGTLI